MDTERFEVSQMLMDVALNKEFKFTIQEAVNYIKPKLNGPPKRRESVIIKAIKRGIKDDLYLECGDKYHLAIPPEDFMDGDNYNVRNKLEGDWNISSDVEGNQSDNMLKKKKKPLSGKVKRRNTLLGTSKNNVKYPKNKKVKKSKAAKIYKALKTKSGLSSGRQRKVKNKRGRRLKSSDTSSSDSSNSACSRRSQDSMSVSLDETNQKDNALEDNGSINPRSFEEPIGMSHSNESRSINDIEREQSQTSQEDERYYPTTDNKNGTQYRYKSIF